MTLKLYISALLGIVMYLTSCTSQTSPGYPRAEEEFTSTELSELKDLDEIIDQAQQFEADNQQSIDSLNTLLNIKKQYQLADYDMAMELCQRSLLYSFTQSVVYLDKLVEIARQLGDKEKIAMARLIQARNLSNAGLYGASLDSLARIDETALTPELKHLRRRFIGFSYIELSDYNIEGPTADINKRRGLIELNISLQHECDSLGKVYVKAYVAARENRLHDACRLYTRALQLLPSDDIYLFTMINTALGDIYKQLGDVHKALHYYIIACDVNIRHSFRDEMALSGLAELLFYKFGDIDRSSTLLSIAITDATEYGSRVRINHIGSLMPLFSGQKIIKEQESRIMLQWLAASVFLLFVLLLVMLIFNLQRNKLLRVSRHNVVAANRQLDQAIANLETTNSQLDEANNVKNAYLGIFLNTQSAISQELNNFALVANQKLKTQKYDDLKRLIDSLEQKYNKRQSLYVIDETIKTIFPSFTNDLNALLRPECRIEQKNPNELPSMVRVFAMIRLGVTDNKEIAKALNYTYNTVLNYRVRVRNMSYDPDTFEEKVAKIGL